MYLLDIYPLGRIRLYIDSIVVCGSNIYILGYDDDRNNISFTLDKIGHPNEFPNGTGYCHIVSYTKNNISTQCNKYVSFSS